MRPSRFVLGLLLVLIAWIWTGAGLAQSLVLNEISASNASGLTDEDGDTEDWIELYNADDVPVSLDGYGISDDSSTPFRWTFPDVELEPGQFLLIWASGKNRTDPAEELHTNFRLDKDGEWLLLADPSGNRIDETPPTPIPTDISYGRQPDGTTNWLFFADPTPGMSNNTQGFGRVLQPPVLSHVAGFYADPFELTASHEADDVVLHYTLDSSEPGTNAPVFPSSLSIASREGNPNVYSIIDPTLTHTTEGGDYWQAPTDLVDKATIVRVQAFAEDALPSPIVTATYFADTNLMDKYSLPILSLVTDPVNFFDQQYGIYVAGPTTNYKLANYWQRGSDWERPVHLEFIDPDGYRNHAQDTGVRIHGGGSRRGCLKSLRFYARSLYGDSDFAYPLFGAESDAMYKRFIIRNSGNDLYFTMFRDALIQRLVEHMWFDTQAYNPIVAFVNGEYWGLMNVRERYDAQYLARVYGVDSENLDILTATHHDNSALIVKQGDADHYAAMLDYIETHGATNAEHYEQIRTMMDTDNYADYLVANIYANNVDWPGNNIEYWRVKTETYEEDAPHGHDGRWRWLMFDTELGFGMYKSDHANFRVNHNTLAFATGAKPGQWWATHPYATFLPREMLKNETFRNTFINRMADQLNTAFRPERVLNMIDEMQAAIEPEIGRHIERYGRPERFGEWIWEDDVDVMRNFAVERPAHQFAHMLSYFTLPGLAEVLVDLASPGQGEVRINTITINEHTLGLADPAHPYPWTGTYVRTIPITLEAIPAPAHRFTGWNGITNEDAVVTLSLDADLAVTAEFEFIPERAATTLHMTWDRSPAQSGPLPILTVYAVNNDGLLDPTYSGEISLAVDGPGPLTGTLTLQAINGVAIFDDLHLEGIGAHAFILEAEDQPEPVITDTLYFPRLIEVLFPRYIQGEQDAEGNNLNRVPYAYRLRVEGLRSNATYRYGNRVVTADDPPEQNGAGNMIIVKTNGVPFIRNTDSPRFESSDLDARHGSFVSDDDGTHEGWFITEPTGNARFTPGHTLHVRIILNDGAGGKVYHHMLTTTGTVKVLAFGSEPHQASAIMDRADYEMNHFVALYDDATGSNRPIATTPIEITGSAMDERYAGFYQDVVSTNPRYWGTLIPNTLTGGVRRIETRSLTDGMLMDVAVHEDGLEKTALPRHGLSAILLNAEAEYPVLLAGGDAVWSADYAWNTDRHPSSTGAVAVIPIPVQGNRNVDLGADITVGHLEVRTPPDGARNRIRDQSGEATLFFEGTNQTAILLINGEGDGFVEFRVAGGTVLQSDLRLQIDNATGHEEYGALRLREAWTGSGALIKDGPGTASLTGGNKTYSGETVIEQGVLRITEPATPGHSTQIIVRAGAQLRLISGNTPRFYAFGGPLLLAGTGPPDSPIPGALSYHPGSGTHAAEMVSPIGLKADTEMHVHEPSNTLTLAGPFDGAYNVTKSGAGVLRWKSEHAGTSGTWTVRGGTLDVHTALPAAVTVSPGAVLTGSGTVGPIKGGGVLSLQNTILNAESVNGLNYAFGLAQTGSPDYAYPWSSGNALLRLRSDTPFMYAFNPVNHIAVFIDQEALHVDEVYRGGFFVDDTEDFLPAIQQATYTFLVPDPEGMFLFEGKSYAPYSGPWNFMIDTAWTIADFEDGTTTGRVMRVRFEEGTLPYEQWLTENFTPEELDDPAISGPEAIPDGSLLPNLARYAFGLDRHESVHDAIPHLEAGRDDEHVYIDYIYRSLVDDEGGIEYTPEVTYDLLHTWAPAGMVITNAVLIVGDPVAEGATREMRLRIPGKALTESIYIRLRIRQLEDGP